MPCLIVRLPVLDCLLAGVLETMFSQQSQYVTQNIIVPPDSNNIPNALEAPLRQLWYTAVPPFTIWVLWP